MALRKKLTVAPEAALASHYRKVSETEWVLDLEGEEDENPKLKELRETNISTLKERDALKAKLAELEVAAQKAAPIGEENKTLSQKVDHLTRQWETEKAARASAESRARQEGFRSEFMGLASKHKVRDDGAASALYAIAQTTFKETEGVFTPKDKHGNTIYSKQSTNPISLEEWIEDKKGNGYKDLFQQPTGGGGRGSSGVGNSGAPRITLTRAQAQSPTAEQFKAMQEGRVDVEG